MISWFLCLGWLLFELDMFMVLIGFSAMCFVLILYQSFWFWICVCFVVNFSILLVNTHWMYILVPEIWTQNVSLSSFRKSCLKLLSVSFAWPFQTSISCFLFFSKSDLHFFAISFYEVLLLSWLFSTLLYFQI